MEWFAAPGYDLARTLVQRGVGVIYVLAFANVLMEWRPLLGDHGLLPVSRVVARVSFRRAPSLLHWRHDDRTVMALGWTGLVLALLVVAGVVAWLPSWARAAGLARPVGPVPVGRDRRAGLLRLRVGVDPARGRVPRGLPGVGGRRPSGTGPVAGALAGLPDRVRGGPDQDARGPLLARPDLPRLPPRDPAAARSAVVALPPPAHLDASGRDRRRTTSCSWWCRGCCSPRSRSPASRPRRSW